MTSFAHNSNDMFTLGLELVVCNRTGGRRVGACDTPQAPSRLSHAMTDEHMDDGGGLKLKQAVIGFLHVYSAY